MYKVPFVLKSQGSAVVEAASATEAEEKVEEMTFEELVDATLHQGRELDLDIQSNDVFKLFDY